METQGSPENLEVKEKEVEKEALGIAVNALTAITETRDGVLKHQIAEDALSKIRRLTKAPKDSASELDFEE